MQYSNKLVRIEARPCTSNIEFLPDQRFALFCIHVLHVRDDEQVPVMALRDNYRHSWNINICKTRFRGAKVLQLAKAIDKGMEPESKLRLNVCPAFVRIFGLAVDRDGLFTGLVYSYVVPAFSYRIREGLELLIGRIDLGISLEDKGVIDHPFGDGGRECYEGFRVDGSTLARKHVSLKQILSP